MSKIYDNVNMHFDDVFIIYSLGSNGSVSSTDYIYFDEENAQNDADSLNKEFPLLTHKVGTLTEFIGALREE